MQWFYKLESSSIIEFQNRNFEIGNLLKMQRSMCFIQYIILLWWCVISKWNSNVFGHVMKKRKENNKKIQRHVIMKSCCLWTYYLNIENKVTYSSPKINLPKCHPNKQCQLNDRNWNIDVLYLQCCFQNKVKMHNKTFWNDKKSKSHFIHPFS